MDVCMQTQKYIYRCRQTQLYPHIYMYAQRKTNTYKHRHTDSPCTHMCTEIDTHTYKYR